MFNFCLYLCFLVSVSCSLTSKIIGGKIAEDHEFPFMVLIRRTELDEILDYSPICGGALIDNETVVTAAHCVFDKFGNFLGAADSFTITAGTNSQLLIDETTIIRKSKNVFAHSQYNQNNTYNDIAVIKLNAPIRLDGRNVDKIPIARRPMVEGVTCTIPGWGYLNKFEAIVPEFLHKVNVTIMNKESCRTNYSTYINYEISDNQLCAGSPDGGKDSCQGDSGGPLICMNQIYGIVSTGYGCGEPGFPGIYTDVTKYLDFLDNSSIPLDECKCNYGNSIYTAALKTIFINLFFVIVTVDNY